MSQLKAIEKSILKMNKEKLIQFFEFLFNEFEFLVSFNKEKFTKLMDLIVMKIQPEFKNFKALDAAVLEENIEKIKAKIITEAI